MHMMMHAITFTFTFKLMAFEFDDSENPIIHAKSVSRNNICAILAYHCLNLVALATTFTPSKMSIAYLNSHVP